MTNHWVLVGVLAGSLCASDALAQHQAPNQQPDTAADATAPTGDLVLGRVRLPRAVTADGKPLPAGAYDVKLTGQEAKPQAVGTTETLERWVEFVQGGTVKGREVVSIVPQAEIKMVVKDAPPAGKRFQGPDPAGQRLPARLDQQGGQPLPDPPARRRQRRALTGAAHGKW